MQGLTAKGGGEALTPPQDLGRSDDEATEQAANVAFAGGPGAESIAVGEGAGPDFANA